MSCLLRLLGLAGILWMFGRGVFGDDWSLAGLVMPVSTFVLFVANQVDRSEARRREAEAERKAPARPPARPDGDGPDATPH
ncbi:hypothetical protein [Kitasatospora sp. NPDC004272]